MSEFKPMVKIPRFFRDIVITEKIDGTNASVHIGEDGSFRTGSRTRWITPENDNFGFSKWAHDNKDELMKLGPGSHFGEWWGVGIQRGYGLSERRFSLFNVGKWTAENKPTCCHLVPILHIGPMKEQSIGFALEQLRQFGSVAVPGFAKPEGIVIYHAASGHIYKVTCEKDEKPKGVEV